jgi:cellulose synthase/poly-beta-1,6-N-acetylglucosamine synthase-like glycosyltransferase
MVVVAVFWVCLAVCLFVYAGYPLLLVALSRLRPRPVKAAPVTPRVAIVIPVHNEQGVIAEKLENCLALDYPAERLQVLVVADGCTDGTEGLVRAHPDPRVSLVAVPRGGKVAALNAGAARAEGDVLVFTDADAMLERAALRHLVAPFADASVGGVCGHKRQRGKDGGATSGGDGLYWRYEQWQKRLESAFGSVYAADGSLYAVRRALYAPIADAAQADDIAISARVVLQGGRLVFEPEAVAWEAAPRAAAREFARKVRVTNHSLRALLGLGAGLWSHGLYSLELLSHKLLRHLAPFFMLGLLLASLLLAGRPFYLWMLALQACVYALALAGWTLRRTRLGRARLLTVPWYFCFVNAAALVGVLSVLRGTRLGAWTPRGGLTAHGESA